MILYEYIGSESSDNRPFSVSRIKQHPYSGELCLYIDEGSWVLYQDSEYVYTTRHGHEFAVIETEDGLPTKVTFKDAVSDPRFYRQVA